MVQEKQRGEVKGIMDVEKSFNDSKINNFTFSYKLQMKIQQKWDLN